MSQAATNPQNWEALLELELRRGRDKTRLVPIRRYGPLSVQRPFYPEQECCHVYLLHPPGGVVGGDRLDLQIRVEDAAQGLLTTPGACKFYLSAADTAQVTQTFRLEGKSQLEFLPQENIYFPGARVHTRTSIHAEPESRLVLWEKHCFGRPANQEFFAHGELISEIHLHRGKQLIYTEKQRVDANELNRASGLRNNAVMGSLLVYGTQPEKDLIQRLRAITPQSGASGITRILPDLLVARYIGNSTADINHYFVRLWELLRPATLHRPASHPRIWNT